MFENLKPVAGDPILGLMAAFRADSRDHKIDLGVGVYQDDSGRTPVMKSVKLAEAKLMELENTKAYQGIAGDAGYNQLMMALLFGADHSILNSDRLVTLQAPGGSGSLRVGAEVVQRARPDAKLWVGIPTWPNHIPLMGSAGFEIEDYPYYDKTTHSINIDAMMETLNRVPAGDVVLLHGCCHNPTGADLQPEHWDQIADIALEREFIPFIDIAYQGLGQGLEATSGRRQRVWRRDRRSARRVTAGSSVWRLVRGWLANGRVLGCTARVARGGCSRRAEATTRRSCRAR